MYQQIKKELKKAHNILLISHIDPDGDSLGSMLAIFQMLSIQGKNVVMYCEDPVPEVYDFLPNASEIIHEITHKNFDLVITLDAGSLKRAGKINLRGLGRKIINIDHHIDNTLYGDINLVEKSSSCGEIIFNLAKAISMPIDKETAICLYTAIMTDTGSFRYNNTSLATFKTVQELYAKGINVSDIASKVYDNKPIGSLRILAKALENIKVSASGKIAHSTVTEEMQKKAGAKEEDLAGLIDKIRSVKGVEVAFLIRSFKNNQVKVNFRSKSDIDVQKIAKSLGGGGHPRSSGAIFESSLEEAEKKILASIKKAANLE